MKGKIFLYLIVSIITIWSFESVNINSIFKKNRNVKAPIFYFLLGILLISLGIPILDNITSILSAITQYIVYSFAFKIYKVKKQMGIDQDQKQQQEDKQLIGFDVQDSQLLYQEE